LNSENYLKDTKNKETNEQNVKRKLTEKIENGITNNKHLKCMKYHLPEFVFPSKMVNISIDFSGTVFTGRVDFSRKEFTQKAIFYKAQFTEEANFYGIITKKTALSSIIYYSLSTRVNFTLDYITK
jgi:hypothetical protein